MPSLTLPCPAKLNLMLHITGRRPDGYHDLQTLFQLLDYGDTLTLESREDGQLHLDGELDGVPAEQNLVLRAAQLLQQHTQCSLGANLTLTKRLPQGGGLGGGSSDAATTLVGLNALWQLGLTRDALMELGITLGADVPVFILGRSAFAEGVGERLTPMELPETWYLVIHPGVHVSTAKIFSHPLLTRNSPIIKVPSSLRGATRNDCQPTTCQLYPEVDAAVRWLAQYAPALMTGTGACVFASFDECDKAESVLKQLPAKWQGFVAKGVNKSSLFKNLEL